MEINNEESLALTKNVKGKPLDDWARQVWMLDELEDKKLVACAMCDEFDFKSKVALFKKQISESRTAVAVDQIVTNITLFGSGLGVRKKY